MKTNNSFVVHNIWSTPIYENFISVDNEWIKIAKNEKFERMNSKNGDISSDFYILEKIPNLKNEILKHCNFFLDKYLFINKNIQFYLTNSWLVKHKFKDFAQNHFHTNSLLSGVFYLETPENSGHICFLRNTHTNYIFPISFNIDFEKQNNTNCFDYKIEVKKGKIIIFPSHLYHSVLENFSNEDRYSLAFNFYAKGKMGNNEFQLDIK